MILQIASVSDKKSVYSNNADITYKQNVNSLLLYHNTDLIATWITSGYNRMFIELYTIIIREEGVNMQRKILLLKFI